MLSVGPDDGPTASSAKAVQQKAVEECRGRVASLESLIEIADKTLGQAQNRSTCQLELFTDLERAVKPKIASDDVVYGPVEDMPELEPIGSNEAYISQVLSYEDWIAAGSPLSIEQRLSLIHI